MDKMKNDILGELSLMEFSIFYKYSDTMLSNQLTKKTEINKFNINHPIYLSIILYEKKIEE